MAKKRDKVYGEGAMPPANSVRRDSTAAKSNVNNGFGIGAGQHQVKTFGTGMGTPKGSHKKGVC